MDQSRRGFLVGLIAAPLVVKASSLMVLRGEPLYKFNRLGTFLRIRLPNDFQVIELAKERFRLCERMAEEMRERIAHDILYAQGAQWPELFSR